MQHRVFQSLIVAVALFAPFNDATGQETQEREDKLAVHGFLTQAFAFTDEGRYLGIPEAGTSDYRKAALQFRYAMSKKDTAVVQLSHIRQGVSPIQAAKDDIELDWAFYEHRFSDNTSLQVGKVLMPFGIYNKIRDVGTVLPFYRPPVTVYGDDFNFTIETVDGAVLSHTANGGPWSFETELFAGSTRGIESLAAARPGDLIIFESRSDDLVGAHLWVGTPIEGLRFGAGGLRTNTSGSAYQLPGETSESRTFVLGSLEMVRGRFTGQLELFRASLEHVDNRSGYIHIGYGITERLTAHVQVERSKAEIFGKMVDPFGDDDAVALNFAFSPQVMLKAELHATRGYLSDIPARNIFTDSPGRTRYSIVSLSVSF